MKFPQIRMQSQMASIYIEQTKGKQEIKQAKADLQIQQSPAKLTINTSPGKLEINQTQAWEEMNLMNLSKWTKQFAQEGKKDLLEGMARRTRQGTELMKLETKGKPLVDQALSNSYKETKTLGIKFIPSHFAVKTTYKPAQVDIDFQINKPIIETNIQKAKNHYEHGSVDVSMKQYQQLHIDVAY